METIEPELILIGVCIGAFVLWACVKGFSLGGGE